MTDDTLALLALFLISGHLLLFSLIIFALMFGFILLIILVVYALHTWNTPRQTVERVKRDNSETPISCDKNHVAAGAADVKEEKPSTSKQKGLDIDKPSTSGSKLLAFQEEKKSSNNLEIHMVKENSTSLTKEEHDISHSSEKPSTSQWSSASKFFGPGYDVFINYCGKDVRNTFAAHLHAALEGHGISTFLDPKKLKKGEKHAELFAYIEHSVIFVPVFSRRYADSRWCLQEITKIMECVKHKNRLVIPIFHDILPKNVRHQTGPFLESFQKYEEDEKAEVVDQWRQALREVADVSGYVLENFNGCEPDLIKEVVQQILRETNKDICDVGDHPVGVDSRAKEIMPLLNLGGGDVLMVGIFGLGGLGKTTIAKQIFNKLSARFEGTSFVGNIRETWTQENGRPETLKAKILSDILKGHFEDTSREDVIKQRLQKKKVLLVLDDVDDAKQLKALAGSGNWFGQGSRVIITTRDRGVLLNHGIDNDKIYNPSPLKKDESLELFSFHAFGRKEPKPEFAQLSRDILLTTSGLPLAVSHWIPPVSC